MRSQIPPPTEHVYDAREHRGVAFKLRDEFLCRDLRRSLGHRFQRGGVNVRVPQGHIIIEHTLPHRVQAGDVGVFARLDEPADRIRRDIHAGRRGALRATRSLTRHKRVANQVAHLIHFLRV